MEDYTVVGYCAYWKGITVETRTEKASHIVTKVQN